MTRPQRTTEDPEASRVQLPFNSAEEVVDVVALEDALAQRLQHVTLHRRRGIVGERIPARRQLAQLGFVVGPSGLDWRARPLESPLPFVCRRTRRSLRANLVELLVEREHFFEQGRRDRLRRLLRRSHADALGVEQVFDPSDRVPERAIRVVQVRRSFEARSTLGWRRVVEVVRMELPAQVAEAPLEIPWIEVQFPPQAEKRKVIAVAAERQNLGALRTEMRVDRRATATVTTHLKRRGCRRRHRRRAYAPNELPQPQVVFAFGLLNTKPLLIKFVS